ncbi:MAG: TenA family protein [Pseudomonadota bacterium]
MTELFTVPTETALARLIRANGADWEAFTRHRFVEGLGDGSLPEEAFRFYLVQDYRFLIHFARAWALAAFKSDDLDDIKSAAAVVHTLVDEEMQLHVETCAGWGLDEATLRTTPEHPANAAYTRYVLERGLAGDLADLLAALAPCVIGYAEIGARLASTPEATADTNPYAAWVRTYAGDAYQSGAATAAAQLERVLQHRLGSEPWASPRWPDLAATFGQATRLEIGFWEMGPPR